MSEQTYYEAVGRRKTASARVRLYPASEEPEIVVNGKPLAEYFTREMDRLSLLQPLQVTETLNQFNVSVLVKGGGIHGQADAVRLGIARALIKADENLRPTLKKAGFLTRDARAKERKKPGLKRARKAPQYTKR
ncbi:MAG: 30S ribosomal protein S9 [Caldilineae bacterium]|nr:MAG: 30S ribosomal protein S9 [Caldilineae bacterium]